MFQHIKLRPEKVFKMEYNSVLLKNIRTVNRLITSFIGISSILGCSRGQNLLDSLQDGEADGIIRESLSICTGVCRLHRQLSCSSRSSHPLSSAFNLSAPPSTFWPLLWFYLCYFGSLCSTKLRWNERRFYDTTSVWLTTSLENKGWQYIKGPCPLQSPSPAFI